MLAMFLDAQLELKEIKREVDVLKRKKELLSQTNNPELKDSHIRAMAGCIHCAYTGMEKILKDIVKHFDKELPVGDDWHMQLLLRAKNENPGIRPNIIVEDTFVVLNELRGFRHIFRGKYHSSLDPKKVLERTDESTRAYLLFARDLEKFIKTINAPAGTTPGNSSPEDFKAPGD